jgi:hypothetical protein
MPHPTLEVKLDRLSHTVVAHYLQLSEMAAQTREAIEAKVARLEAKVEERSDAVERSLQEVEVTVDRVYQMMQGLESRWDAVASDAGQRGEMDAVHVRSCQIDDLFTNSLEKNGSKKCSKIQFQELIFSSFEICDLLKNT